MRTVGLFVLAGLLTMLTLLSLGCAPAPRPIETEEDCIGFITEVRLNAEGDAVGQILVESHADKIVTRYVITVMNDTLIFRQNGDGLSQAAFEAFEDKQWVEIWFAGPTSGSFPVRGTAAQVVISE